MTTKHVLVEVNVRLEYNEAGDAAIQRYVGLDAEQGKKMATQPGLSREQVELALVHVALMIGHDDASRFDGWADLDEGDLMVYIDDIQEA